MIIIWQKKRDNLCISKLNMAKKHRTNATILQHSNQFAFKKSTTWTCIMFGNSNMSQHEQCTRGKNCSSSNLNVADVGPLDNFWHNADSFFTCGVHFVEFNIHRLTFDCYISFACNGVIPALLSDSCESISIEFNKLFIAIDEPIELQRICRCTNRSNSIPMI